ncbi:hypothetical protein KKI24_12970 [bacterium]|nr:hypothetical protein [bacterium]
MKLGTKRQIRFSNHEPVVDTINLTDRHRQTGLARKYAEDNISTMLKSIETKERLKYNQLYGYVGHTFFKHGFFSDEIPPAQVCTGIKLEWPYLQHTERFLDSEKGKLAESLYDSGTHGFSWAIGGKDGGEYAFTRADFIQGFDLVGTESFISEEKRMMIGESLISKGFSETDAHAIGESLVANSGQMTQQQALFEAQTKINQIQFELEVSQSNQVGMQKRIELIGESFEKLFPVHIPGEIIALMVNPKAKEDSAKVAEFFRRTSGIDTSQLPTRANMNQGRLVIEKKTGPAQPETRHPLDMVFDELPYNLM